ncbi:aryl-sulfate sulfotransferase [Psychroserpens algicola]|uniref:aryl-sulfate sulfotransferase n=1 Tax=Psychroserpens algicola TaxID=1719034 RepID=UPI0019537328|nr:aryl-sulfate sulfotransferase [Psychroserpens algicola]
MIKKLLFGFSLFISSLSVAQNTVGTVSITEEAFEAYTLISIHTKAYLINNCGEVINEWNSSYLPGNAVYLLPNGNLLRAGRLEDGSSNIIFGGLGGIIELFDWDGNIIWSYTYSTNEFRQHHDVFPMTNGNILILAATVLTEAEAIAAGRDPNLLSQSRLFNEQIIEVEPIGANQGNIVWEWNFKDHLIQDFDNTKANFGDVALTPGKLDINFLNGGNGGSNWLHVNSIQYDQNLDQIVISSRNLSEIYIIDHSTTTAEAATDSGGNYGRGGDFLYRWGNPQAYRQGSETDRVLYGQHYPHYIPDGLNDAGKLMIFNNGNGRTPEYSEVLIVNPPTSSPGFYSYTTNTAYGPTSSDYSYSDQSTDPSEFYSSILSSAQRLPNGNTLVCEGRFGEIFEIDDNENIVWEYINPIDGVDGTASMQGGERPSINSLFRATKYAPDFPAFAGRDLSPSPPLEFNPNITACQNLSTTDIDISSISLYPNPASDYIHITSQYPVDKLELYSVLGKKVHEVTLSNSIDVSAVKSGVYFLQIHFKHKRISKKIIKH